MTEPLRVLITAEHASARFGGEAALPLHYFRVLRRRGVPVWLVTHARTRDELVELFPGEERIVYVQDTAFHRAMWRLGRSLPDQISYITTGFLSRLSTQLAQRRLVRRLVHEQGVTVVHQPMPVSPREPSMMFGVGVPVVIGPMNGGMDYPPAFRRHRGGAERLLLACGRASADLLNLLMPGKRRAAVLLVANQRTRDALPANVCSTVIEQVENGVDLAVWRAPPATASVAGEGDVVSFVYMGRLVEWKAVDLLLSAFAAARGRVPMRLSILGDGVERVRLEALADTLGLERGVAPGSVRFAGWLPQEACANELQRADCLVLPSLLECGGAVVLEAMSLAKPVIATAWGGPLDYLDASCGILVAPTTRDAIVERFAEAMLQIGRSAPERHRLGQNGMRRVHSHFDWESKVDRMLETYRTAMRTGRPGPAHQPRPDAGR